MGAQSKIAIFNVKKNLRRISYSVCCLQPVGHGQPASHVLKRCAQVLDPLTRAVPGLQDGLYLMANVKFLSGDVDAAQSTLKHCLDQDSAFSDGHILMAQVNQLENITTLSRIKSVIATSLSTFHNLQNVSHSYKNFNFVIPCTSIQL